MATVAYSIASTNPSPGGQTLTRSGNQDFVAPNAITEIFGVYHGQTRLYGEDYSWSGSTLHIKTAAEGGFDNTDATTPVEIAYTYILIP